MCVTCAGILQKRKEQKNIYWLFNACLCAPSFFPSSLFPPQAEAIPSVFCHRTTKFDTVCDRELQAFVHAFCNADKNYHFKIIFSYFEMVFCSLTLGHFLHVQKCMNSAPWNFPRKILKCLLYILKCLLYILKCLLYILKCLLYILKWAPRNKKRNINIVEFWVNNSFKNEKCCTSKYLWERKCQHKKKIECVCHVQDIFLKKCSEQFWKHLWCIELAVVLPCSLVIPFSSFEHVRYGAGATQHTQLLWRLSSVGNLAWLVPQRTGELQDLLSLRFQVSYSVPIAVELLNSHVPHILK